MASRRTTALSLIMRVSLCCLSAVFTLTACGDEDTKGKVEDTAVETAIDIIEVEAEAIQFETQEVETATEATQPDGDATTLPETDTTTEPDGSEGCRTFGCQCNSNAECLDELCIESADGNICTRTCVADCPDDFDCLAVTTFGDPVSVCVPRHTRLCRPCRADAECDAPGDPYPAYCLSDSDDVPAGATGSFCGSSCANRDCPEGYSCEDTPLSGGGTAKQCVPASGECVCRPSWGELGYSTDCAITNTFGSCDGTRSCTANGLSACLGQQATPEICDAIDNNCDGQTDNLDVTPCMVQNANGQCPGTLGCENNAPKCLGPEPKAETCNGQDDNCNSTTDENSCNDSLACTNDACQNGSECTHELVAGNCLVNSLCFGAGTFNPLNACEVCDPARSTIAFSQPTNTCTINGQCYPANASNPANSCEICTPASSTTAWSQAFNTCSIQGQCFAAGVKDPNNECVVCDPSRSATGWSNASSNVNCDDANACSATSFCDGAGACRGDTTCNDNIACTVDQCDSRTGCRNDDVTPGQCRINGVCYGDGVANPANPCERCAPATSQTTWSPQPTTVACSDNNACTTGDACDGAGACRPGVGCNDGLSCTSDTCNPAVGCSYPTSAGNCRINEGCFADNAVRGGAGVDVCYECEPSASQSAWTFKTGKGCDDNDACSANDQCTANSCKGTPIQDNYEPNNGIDTARSVFPSAICDNGDVDVLANPAHTYSGTLYGQGDIDWYQYRIDDDCSNSQPSPWIRLSNVPSNSDFSLCVYYQCDDFGDGDEGECEDGGGAPSTISFGGRDLKGCCSNGAGSSGEFVYYYPACANGGTFTPDDDTGTAFFRVQHVAGSWSCNAYTIAFGDD